MSADDYLSEWFERSEIKAVLAYYCGIGTFVGPKSPGSAYVVMHHLMGEHAGAGGWGFVRGGMGSITQAIARSGQEKGLVVKTECEVASIETTNGRATGVTLADGTRYEAGIVASNVSAKLTFLKFLDKSRLPAEFVRDVETYRTFSTAFKINIACEALPQYTAFDPQACGFAYPTYTHLGPTIEYLERAYDDAKYGDMSREPFITPVTPSFVDDTVAPPGKHVVHLFGGHAPYTLKEGRLDDAQGRTGAQRHASGRRIRAGLLERHHRHAGADAARHRGEDRLAARPYLPRRAADRSAVLGAARAALGGLSDADQRALPVRRVGPSGRRASAGSSATMRRARSCGIAGGERDRSGEASLALVDRFGDGRPHRRAAVSAGFL